MTRIVSYEYLDRRGGRDARLRRAMDDAEARYPGAAEVEATFTDYPTGPRNDKAPIRVDVRLKEGTA